MTTFYFVLGMVTVLVIAEVVAAFIVIKTINTLKKQARDNENQFNDVYRRIDDIHQGQTRDNENHFNDIHRRIDEETQNTEQEFQEVWRQLDSRLDKLEAKLTTKQVIKG
jgi:biopolymer transport protein ExbB/TolQ